MHEQPGNVSTKPTSELQRRGDVQKCPVCGSHIDPAAYHCPTCRSYFCFHCRARLLEPDTQLQCVNQDCDYYSKLICSVCDPCKETEEPPTVYAEPRGWLLAGLAGSRLGGGCSDLVFHVFPRGGRDRDCDLRRGRILSAPGGNQYLWPGKEGGVSEAVLLPHLHQLQAAREGSPWRCLAKETFGDRGYVDARPNEQSRTMLCLTRFMSFRSKRWPS